MMEVSTRKVLEMMDRDEYERRCTSAYDDAFKYALEHGVYSDEADGFASAYADVDFPDHLTELEDSWAAWNS